MKVDATSIEKLDHTLKGFNYLRVNNEVTVLSAEVDVEGETYSIELDSYLEGSWVVDFS